ncbi:MAG: lipocalin-like domain-containing protein [Verrucomicrobiota bacterium]
MKFWLLLLLSQAPLGALATEWPEWQKALPGWEYQFPADHYAHDAFKTEWWYFTGHLATEEGRPYGFQITFFRQGLRPPGSVAVASRFVRDHFQFGHFALSDLRARAFWYTQEIDRGAFGGSGVGRPGSTQLVFLKDWELHLTEDGGFHVIAESEGRRLELTLRPTRGPIFNGQNGVSQKAVGLGNATHYYTFPRLQATGTLVAKPGRKAESVSGEVWLDREWGSNQLASNQVGWDWFSLQFANGDSLMLYQLRQSDGSADPMSSGTWIPREGEPIHLKKNDFDLLPRRTWKSPRTEGEYPIDWTLRVPSQGVDLEVKAVFPAQELVLEPIGYWEGVVKAKGSHEGEGYLEMTGYADELETLQD